MAIRITLECGHASLLRTRTTPEGYTHDWEVFVRGVDNADISQYVDKVIFQLHETFPKPKRVLKDAPYIVKESGYAGFMIPIYIYLKNKDEPKKIQILYDLTLQQSGPPITNVIKHSEIITNPAEDFRRKLLKGGGVTVSNPDESHDKSESKVAVQMVGKPKLSGTETKKHRPVEPRSTNQFAHLFGVPIKTGNKVSPENKKNQEKANYHKTPPEKTEKIDKPNKSKHSPHKDSKKEKTEEKKEKREKDVTKEKDRSKEKVKRPQSPAPKADYQSPIPKRPQSPASKKQLSPHDSNVQKSSSPKIRDKEHKKLISDRDKHIEKPKEPLVKPPEDVKIDKKKKKHKDDKESDRKDKNREKERDKSKEAKPIEKKSEKHEKPEKQASNLKLQENRPQKDDKKSPKIPKDGERSSSKNRPEKSDVDKPKDQKSDKERQKHKHRKKDKKERSDDSREREKREKKEKQKSTYEKESTPTAVPAVNPLSTLLAEVQDRDSSDSVNSGDEDDQKQMISSKNDADSNRLVPDIRLTRPVSPSGSSGKKNEKIKKDKSKPSRESDDRESKKRKRRSDSKGDDEVPVKREKEPDFSPPIEPVSSSQSPVAVDSATNYSNNSVKEQDDDLHNKEAFETEQIAPDSTNNILVESENDEPLVFSDDYVSQLKDLQHKIMTLQDNQELQRVVQVIAATGQYEITRKTFDFDLCALDRRTVQRLQQFFSAS